MTAPVELPLLPAAHGSVVGAPGPERAVLVKRARWLAWLGLGWQVVTLATMPPLAAAKRRVAEQLGSSAAASESRQTMLCAYLSAALLVGLLANAVMGWWWADPVVALAIGAAALREARDAWRGETCAC